LPLSTTVSQISDTENCVLKSVSCSNCPVKDVSQKFATISVFNSGGVPFNTGSNRDFQGYTENLNWWLKAGVVINRKTLRIIP